MTRVVIVGTGFVARLVERALDDRGVTSVMIHAPRITGRATDSDQVARIFPEAIADLAARFAGADAVVNAAGMPDASASESDALWGANAVLPGICAHAARRAGVGRFVHVSSAVVQGRRPTLDESADTEEFSAYCSSKVLGERLALGAAPGITVVYRPPSVHARDRRVTRGLTRIARSPFSCVAGAGDRPTPQALGVNVGAALAHLALTPASPPDIVAHPSEGLTTGSLLRLLGDREPLHIPDRLARAILSAARALEGVAPAGRAHTRRLEMVWFGQGQAPSWLTSDGWRPSTGEELWRELGRDAAAAKHDQTPRPSIVFGVTTGIVVKSFFTGQLAMLRENGWDVTVLATAENGAREAAVGEGAEFVQIAAVRDTSPLRDLRTLIGLVRELHRRKPDLAVWGTPKIGLLGTIASRLTGGRSVYVLHGLRLETTRGHRRLLLSLTERIAARLADDVVAVGHDLRDQAVQLGLVAEDKVHVLGHGSANGVVVAPSEPGARRRLGLPEDVVVVGFVGRVTRDKGVIELLRVWPDVHRRTGAHLAVAGMQEPDAMTEPITSLLGAAPALHYLGHRDDLADVYEALDVLVLPSHREGLPTVVLEASAHGVPCVVSDATGASEPVDDGASGLVVPVGDELALGEAIVQLCEDPETRARMGEAARSSVTRRYGRDVVHERWLRYYEASLPRGQVLDA